jgi:hypothetical protein
MGWSGRQKHRDRARDRDDEEPVARGVRAFRITDSQREQIAASLRSIDNARLALEARHDAANRMIIRELRASADRVFDLINDLEEID